MKVFRNIGMLLCCLSLPLAIGWILSTWIVQGTMFLLQITVIGTLCIGGLQYLWRKLRPKPDERIVVMTPSGLGYLDTRAKNAQTKIRIPQ